VQVVNEKKLPEWLTALQAVTWLVTTDIAWTLRAVAKRERETERIAPLNLPKAERVELDRHVHGPPAPFLNDDRALAIGDPDDWTGGITLELLNIKAGDKDASRWALEKLVAVVRAGDVKAIEDSGEMLPINSAQWRNQILIEHPSGKLVMAPSDYKLRTIRALRGVLFARDDVLRLSRGEITAAVAQSPSNLVEMGKSATVFAPAIGKVKPKQVEMAAWYGARVADWPDGELPPTRDQDVVEAQDHFGVKGLRMLVRQARREGAPSHWKEPGRNGRKKQRDVAQKQSGQK
jgi:hypothetical protein